MRCGRCPPPLSGGSLAQRAPAGPAGDLARGEGHLHEADGLHLTRERLRTYIRTTPPHIELARDTILGDLSDEELTTLAGLLERVTGRLDAR
ncbi:hypothetical protein [Brachybacterium paraconglomeratum]|uniref:hypothetical protein n=1 Tax=Brachybacterium paraconglomeratum TaxID=173362 RepID=UPI0022E72634|nr:hypothetical protein [Brachybacterium paraconglomeratum]